MLFENFTYWERNSTDAGSCFRCLLLHPTHRTVPGHSINVVVEWMDEGMTKPLYVQIEMWYTVWDNVK